MAPGERRYVHVRNKFADIDNIQIPFESDDCDSNFHLYVLLFECGKALSPFSNPNQFDKETHPREFNWYQYTKDVDAWEIAWDIVCDLDLDINYHKFSSFKYNYLLKYFNNNKII